MNFIYDFFKTITLLNLECSVIGVLVFSLMYFRNYRYLQSILTGIVFNLAIFSYFNSENFPYDYVTSVVCICFVGLSLCFTKPKEN